MTTTTEGPGVGVVVLLVAAVAGIEVGALSGLMGAGSVAIL